MKNCLSLTTYLNGLALDICKLSITHMQGRWVGVKVNIVPTERPRQKDETLNNLSSLSICHCYILLPSSKSTLNEEISQVPRKGRSTMSFPIPAALASTFPTPSSHHLSALSNPHHHIVSFVHSRKKRQQNPSLY